MEKDKAIEVLNALITINNDRIEGYERKKKNNHSKYLASYFSLFEHHLTSLNNSAKINFLTWPSKVPIWS